jgi:hypothetical protein
VGFGLFALMGGWWALTCGPAAAVFAAGTGVWLWLQRMADDAARLNHDTLHRLRHRKSATEMWKEPGREP